MLLPKRTKYRKLQKGRVKGNASRGHEIAFGSFAMKVLEPAFLTSRQIEAARQAITRRMKREGKIWIRIFRIKGFSGLYRIVSDIVLGWFGYQEG